MSESLNKKEKLTKRFQFERVYKEGEHFSGRRLKLALFVNGLGNNRVGFAVTKKLLKLSTRRNHLKRLLREAYRHNKDKIRPGLDIVIIARNATGKIELKTIESELVKLANKAGVLISNG